MIQAKLEFDDSTQMLSCKICFVKDKIIAAELEKICNEALSTQIQVDMFNINLFICKKLVENAGGAYYVESSNELVSEVILCIVLPMARADGDDPRESQLLPQPDEGEQDSSGDESISETNRSDYLSVIKQVNEANESQSSTSKQRPKRKRKHRFMT